MSTKDCEPPLHTIEEFATRIIYILIERGLLDPDATISRCKFGNCTCSGRAHSFEVELGQREACRSLQGYTEEQFALTPSRVVLRVGSEHHHDFTLEEEDVVASIEHVEHWQLVLSGVPKAQRDRGAERAMAMLRQIYSPGLREVEVKDRPIDIDAGFDPIPRRREVGECG